MGFTSQRGAIASSIPSQMQPASAFYAVYKKASARDWKFETFLPP
ncbi:hypothetical protein [Leptolyngbya sp. BC1307]|nr:hypothetical protein [Leptolyngbya sp. BC1307]